MTIPQAETLLDAIDHLQKRVSKIRTAANLCEASWLIENGWTHNLTTWDQPMWTKPSPITGAICVRRYADEAIELEKTWATGVVDSWVDPNWVDEDGHPLGRAG